MNTEGRKRMRELSEKATKGPWESVEAIREIDGYDCSEIQIGPPGLLVAVIPAVHYGDFEQVVRNDAEFIAAARVAVLEEVRKAAEKITSAMEYQSFEDWSETEEYDALKSALDLAGEK